jgi:hypothetical protein
MTWRLFLLLLFALAYLVWIWRGRKAYSRIGGLLCLIGSVGIFINVVDEYIRTLPSHAPLRTITGLATNKSSTFLSSHSDFMLIEAGTGRRTLFTTAINGPWADQPVRATYVDDGRFMPHVVRIEILNDAQFPWHVEKGHAGWIGNAEAKRRPPLLMTFIALVFIVSGALAPTTKMTSPEQLEGRTPAIPGVYPSIRQ